MAKTYPLENNFTKGEVSPKLLARSDTRAFANGAETVQNLIVDPRGGVYARGGFKHIANAKTNTGKVRLIPFIFNNTPEQSYVLEFSNRIIRIFQNHALLTRDQEAKDLDYGFSWTSATDGGSPAPSGSDGLNMVAITGITSTLNFRVEIDADGTPDTFKWSVDGGVNSVASGVSCDTANIDLADGSFDGTITVNFDSTTAYNKFDLWDTVIYPSTAALEIDTPYVEADLDELRYRQSADILYLTHKNYGPMQLRRKGAKEWELSPHGFNNSPFEAQADTLYKLFDSETANGFARRMANDAGEYTQLFTEDPSSQHVLIDSDKKHSGRIAWSDNSNTDAPDAVPSYIADGIVGHKKYSIQYTGLLDIEETGSYQFQVKSNGGFEFAIDSGTGLTITAATNRREFSIGTWVAGEHAKASEEITYAELGQYSFRLRSLSGIDTPYGVALYWKKPSDSSYSIIPASSFTDRKVDKSVSQATAELWDYAPKALDDSTNGGTGTWTAGHPTNTAAMDFLFAIDDTYGVQRTREEKYQDRVAWSTAYDDYTTTVDKVPGPHPYYIPTYGNIGWIMSGWLYAPTTGDYYFSLDSNDAADLSIKVSDTWTVYAEWYGAHANNPNGSVTLGLQFHNASVAGYDTARSLTKGWHQIRVRLFSGGFGAAVGIAWSKPTDRTDPTVAPGSESDWVVIPKENLGTDKDNENNPRLVALYQNRLIYAHSLKHPQRAWFSKTADYNDFSEGDNETDGFFLDIADDQVNGIQWLSSGRKLLAGTLSHEHAIGGVDGTISPDDPEAHKQSNYGSEFIDPVSVEHVLVFAQKHGIQLRELFYAFDSDSYRGRDDSVLSDHLLVDRIREMHLMRGGLFNMIGSTLAVYPIPTTTIWVLTESGLLRGVTYELEQEVIAFHKHDTGVANSDTGRIIDSACVIPSKQTLGHNSEEYTGDELYVAVSRNGGATRSIEYLDTQSVVDGAGGSYASAYVPVTLTMLPADKLIQGQGSTMTWPKRWPQVTVRFNDSTGDVSLFNSGAGTGAQTISLGASLVSTDKTISPLLGWDKKGQLKIQVACVSPLHILGISGILEEHGP